MKIAYSKTRQDFPLSPKKIIKKTISSMVGYAVLLLILGVVMSVAFGTTGQSVLGYLGNLPIGVVPLSLVVVAILTYLYQRWYYEAYFYDLTPDFIQIKKGPITPREITLPYERVQDVYVDQDILDRFFGLYDVHVSSATFLSGMQAHIDGVEEKSAQKLREILLGAVKEKISMNKEVRANNSNV